MRQIALHAALALAACVADQPRTRSCRSRSLRWLRIELDVAVRASVKSGWQFTGTIAYLERDEHFAATRGWFVPLFRALERGDWAAARAMTDSAP